MNWQDVLEKLRSLKLPAHGYLVVGGAALAARGIRETDDIDLVVIPELFETLRRSGWLPTRRPNGKPGLRLGAVEAYLDVNCGNARRTTESLLQRADEVDGIRVADLETLERFKAAYARVKDLRDRQLIEDYRAAQAQRSGQQAPTGEA